MSLHVENPYNVPNKRQRGGDGSYNPNIPRRLDVGTQLFKGILDGIRIVQQMRETGGVLPQVSLNAHSLHYGDGVYMLESDASEPTPPVQKLFNGHDAQFAMQFAGDAEAQKLAMKQSVRVLGCAGEAVKLSPDNMTPQVSIKYTGLHNFNVVSARAGARVVWDLRPFASTVEGNVAHGSDQSTELLNSFGLILTSYSEETAGTQFNKAASLLINDSLTWERALTNYYGKSRPWLSAVMAHFRNCQTAFILGIERALRFNLLAVPGVNVSNRAAQPRVPVELAVGAPVPAGGGPPSLTSYELAARFANFMNLTTPTDTLSPVLDSDGIDAWETFVHQLAESLYYTSNISTGGHMNGTVNAAVEFGASYNPVNGAVFDGRHENYQIKDDRIGSVVRLQCNSTQQAVSSFLHANSEVNKWMAGTAMSGATDGPALVMMHK